MDFVGRNEVCTVQKRTMKSLVMEIQKLHDEACSGGDQRQKIFKFQHTEKKEKKWQFDDRAILKGLLSRLHQCVEMCLTHTKYLKTDHNQVFLLIPFLLSTNGNSKSKAYEHS